jgi:hypothetical protein
LLAMTRKPDVIWTARRLGQDRARVGIPLNNLLTAVRLGFKVFWEVFRSYAGPDDRELLVTGVEKIWAAIERYSIEAINQAPAPTPTPVHPANWRPLIERVVAEVYSPPM